MILDRYFELNMASSSSGSLGSISAIIDQDDSMPLWGQIERQRYYNQTPRFISHSSDIDDDGDDEGEISDEQPPISAFYEADGLYISYNSYVLISLS